MKRDCIVIPANLNKANWLISFLASVEAHGNYDNFDIILGLSNQREYRMFSRIIPQISNNKRIKYINIESLIINKLKSKELVDRFNNNTDKCIVNLKKLLLLYWALINNYDGILSIDADSFVSKSMETIFDTLRSNYKKNLYVGTSNDREDTTKIAVYCMRHFGDDAQKIFNQTNGRIIYTWFFDAPFYEASDLSDFFEYMSHNHGSIEKWLLNIKYEDFEHTIFQYWRVLKKEAQFFDTKSFTNNFFPESYLYEHIAKIYDITGYCPVWIYTWEFLHQPDILTPFQEIYMLNHFDRMNLFL